MTNRKSARKDHQEPQLDDLDMQIARLCAKPLLVLCRTPKGEERAMTVQECRQTNSAYIRILVPNELDELLEKELGDRTSVEH